MKSEDDWCISMPVTIVEIKEEVMKLVEEEDIPSLQRYMTYLRMIDKKRERSYDFLED